MSEETTRDGVGMPKTARKFSGPQPARRQDDRRLASVRAKERAVRDLLPPAWPGAQPAPPTPRQVALVEAVMEVTACIRALEARKDARVLARGGRNLAPAQVELLKLHERRAQLLRDLEAK